MNDTKVGIAALIVYIAAMIIILVFLFGEPSHDTHNPGIRVTIVGVTDSLLMEQNKLLLRIATDLEKKPDPQMK